MLSNDHCVLEGTIIKPIVVVLGQVQRTPNAENVTQSCSTHIVIIISLNFLICF